MILGIAMLLISAAAGYWVLIRASGEKGVMKLLGLLLGLVIVGTSLFCLAWAPSQIRAARNQMGALEGYRPPLQGRPADPSIPRPPLLERPKPPPIPPAPPMGQGTGSTARQ